MKEKTNLGIVRETCLATKSRRGLFIYPLYVSIYYILLCVVGSVLCVWPLCELIEASVWRKRPDVVYFFSQGAIYLCVCVLHVVHVVHIYFFSNFLYFFLSFFSKKLKVVENRGGDLEPRCCCCDGVYRCSSSWETCVGGGLKKNIPTNMCRALKWRRRRRASLFFSVFFSVSFQRVVIYLGGF